MSILSRFKKTPPKEVKKGGKKETTEPAEVVSTHVEQQPERAPKKQSLSRYGVGVIIAPYITEKSSRVATCSTFHVEQSATKSDVRRAIQALYGVKPTRINIVREPQTRRRLRSGRLSITQGKKKAIVTFKAGVQIDITKAPHSV